MIASRTVFVVCIVLANGLMSTFIRTFAAIMITQFNSSNLIKNCNIQSRGLEFCGIKIDLDFLVYVVINWALASVNFESKYNFHSERWAWICFLQIGGHGASTSMYWDAHYPCTKWSHPTVFVYVIVCKSPFLWFFSIPFFTLNKFK